MPRLSRDQRATMVDPTLSGIRDRLLAKITEHCPDAVDSLPLPPIEVPAADGYEAAVKELYDNVFDESGNRSQTWIDARETAANPDAVNEVHELVVDWYIVLGAAKQYLDGRALGRFDREAQRLRVRLL